MDLLKHISDHGKQCTGCGACFNICPNHAIGMEPDKDGFLYPAIDQSLCTNCNKCEGTCPALHPNQQEYVKAVCYVLMPQEDTYKGDDGFLAAVANVILNKGGVVYGAAWTEDWKVQHVETETAPDFQESQSTKYLQSETGRTFQQVKKRLEEGRYVLYTGVPCQIAALYAYLGSTPADKLYTIDFACYGVTSSKVFYKYLEECYPNTKPKCAPLNRDEAIGKSQGNDSFYEAYIHRLCLRTSCSQCQYNVCPRPGDFSYGDFGGLEGNSEYDGTFCIWVNSLRAHKLLPSLAPDLKQWKYVDPNGSNEIKRTVVHSFPHHPGRKHFFSALDNKSFSTAVEAGIKHHYDIGIVGLWYGINYGSVLTYYALYALLRNLGYDPVMLPKPNGMWQELYNAPDTLAQRFIWNHCNVFLPFNQIEEYPRANDLCDDFIVGSDLVWYYKVCGKESGQFFFLDWVERGHKKIAYAASFGHTLTGPEEHVQVATYNLCRFDAISCREAQGVEALKQIIPNQEITHVLDPVFVCDPAIYEDIVKAVSVHSKEKTVFGYFLQTTGGAEKKKILSYAAEKFKAKAVICVNPNPADNIDKMLTFYGTEARSDLTVEEWLYYIKNSNFYVGDSYHGLCFALIFHVPFFIVYVPPEPNKTIARFESLLQAVGLEHRSSKDMEYISTHYRELVDDEIDWEEVDRRLDAWRKTSKEWLVNALNQPKAPMTPEDYAYNYQKRKESETIVRFDDEIRKLRQDLRVRTSDPETATSGSFSTRFRCKIKRGIQCYKDNGFRYTWKRFCQKLKKWFNK